MPPKLIGGVATVCPDPLLTAENRYISSARPNKLPSCPLQTGEGQNYSCFDEYNKQTKGARVNNNPVFEVGNFCSYLSPYLLSALNIGQSGR
jgi:hypothetical protein